MICCEHVVGMLVPGEAVFVAVPGEWVQGGVDLEPGKSLVEEGLVRLLLGTGIDEGNWAL